MLGVINSLSSPPSDAWRPDKITGLALHYDFNNSISAIGAADRDDMSSLVMRNFGTAGSNYDITMNGNPAADVANAGFTNRTSLALDGTNDRAVLANHWVATDEKWTMFAVFHINGTIGEECFIAGDNGGRNRISLYNDNNLQIRYNSDAGTDNAAISIANNNTDNSSTSYTWNNDPDIIVIRNDSSKHVYTYSGSAAASTAWFISKDTDYESSDKTNIRVETVGAFANDDKNVTGWIGEVGFYDNDISESEVLTNLIPHLKHKWSI